MVCEGRAGSAADIENVLAGLGRQGVESVVGGLAPADMEFIHRGQVVDGQMVEIDAHGLEPGVDARQQPGAAIVPCDRAFIDRHESLEYRANWHGIGEQAGVETGV